MADVLEIVLSPKRTKFFGRFLAYNQGLNHLINTLSIDFSTVYVTLL